MIDFRFDGPCGSGAEGGARLRVLGLGQAGIAALDQLILHGKETMDLWALDTDQQTLDGSVLRDKILLGPDMTFGLGCGGDVELAREVVEATAEDWASTVKNTEYLVLMVGLGGATGNALATEIVRMTRREETRVIVLATLPFGFEGRRRRDQAERTLSQLRATADAVMVFSNDRLADLPESRHNLRHSYGRLNRTMAECVNALGQMLCRQGMIQLTFADVRCLFGRYSGTEVLENCWAAYAEVDASAGPERLVGEILSDPMIGDDVWEQADHALVCLSGGEDLSLTDVQETLGAMQENMPEEFPIATGATLLESAKGKLRMVLLLASTRVPAAGSKPAETENPALKENFVFGDPQLTDTAPLPKIKLTEPNPELSVDLDELEEESEEVFADDELEEASELDEDVSGEPAPRPAAVLPPVKPEPVTVSENATTQRIDIPNYYKEQVEMDEDELLEPAVVGHDGAAAPARASVRSSRQEELQLDAPHRGRFEKSIETIYNGEDLDVPTFRRRRLKVRL